MVEAGLLKSDCCSFRAENAKENALIYSPGKLGRSMLRRNVGCVRFES